MRSIIVPVNPEASLGEAQAKFSNCGKILKQFQPNIASNRLCGTGNDSWYGKIEIDI